MPSINLIYEESAIHHVPQQGYNSYLRDVVESAGEAVSLNSQDHHKYTILFHYLAKPSYIPYDPEYVVRILHSGEKQEPVEDLNWFDKDRILYITQYKDQADFLQECGYNAYYVPMRIRVDGLPSKSGNSKAVYFGNVYENKEETLRLIKSVCDVDVVSFGRLNDGDVVMDRSECLDVVSGYSFGIGVGRCALEMVAMGMPVLVAGKNVGGMLASQEDLDFHSLCNCNSDLSNSQGIEQDVETLMESTQSISQESVTFDIHRWIKPIIDHDARTT